MTPDEAKARLLDWANHDAAERAAHGMNPVLKGALIGGGVLLAGSILKRAGIKRIASILFLTRGLPYFIRSAVKSTLKSSLKGALKDAKNEPAI